MRKKNNSRLLKKLRLVEIMLFSIAFFIFLLIFNSALKYAKFTDLNQLPLIKKTNLDFKTQPQNTAGLVIMHQNKTIYDNLKSQTKNETQKNTIPLKINEDLLITLRSSYLQKEQKAITDPFTIVEENVEQYIISFGTTSNQETAETKLQRLASLYQELTQSKFKIFQIDKDKYKLETLISMDEKNAAAICKKIKLTGDECHVTRLPKN